MKTIHVKASAEYDVIAADGILSDLGKYVRDISQVCRAALISDDKVFSLYGETAVKSLESAGFDTCVHTFANGEKSKNFAELEKILNFLAENKITRTDIVIALGGGVTGDMAGFASAIYLRGIRFIQVPTTLLAAVDASVGGKTAVDLACGKNLAGAFHQPAMVLCDTDTFKTLGNIELADGISEAIKCGMINDKPLFDMLYGGKCVDYEEIIYHAVNVKRNVVEEDEFDTGSRQLLNFGHTLGHAIEKCSNFAVSHGHAVAIGMAVFTKAAEKTGFCESGTYAQLCTALDNNNLPTECEFSAEELIDTMLSDKKRAGNEITLVLPKKIGECVLHKIQVSALEDFIKKGLEHDC